MSAGACIQACRASHRHILAFEEDKAIFDAVIGPVLRQAPVENSHLPPTVEGIDVEDDAVPVQVIVKTSRFSK